MATPGHRPRPDRGHRQRQGLPPLGWAGGHREVRAVSAKCFRAPCWARVAPECQEQCAVLFAMHGAVCNERCCLQCTQRLQRTERCTPHRLFPCRQTALLWHCPLCPLRCRRAATGSNASIASNGKLVQKELQLPEPCTPLHSEHANRGAARASQSRPLCIRAAHRAHARGTHAHDAHTRTRSAEPHAPWTNHSSQEAAPAERTAGRGPAPPRICLSIGQRAANQHEDGVGLASGERRRRAGFLRPPLR